MIHRAFATLKRQAPSIDWSGTRWASNEPDPITAPPGADPIGVRLWLPRDDNGIHGADYQAAADRLIPGVEAAFEGFWPIDITTVLEPRVPDDAAVGYDYLEWMMGKGKFSHQDRKVHARHANLLLGPNHGTWGDTGWGSAYGRVGNAWKATRDDPEDHRILTLNSLLHELGHCLDLEHGDGRIMHSYDQVGTSYETQWTRNEKQLMKEYLLKKERQRG